MKYTKEKQEKTKNRENELEKRLIALEKKIKVTKDLRAYEEVKQELKEIDNQKVNGLMVRSRVQWHE